MHPGALTFRWVGVERHVGALPLRRARTRRPGELEAPTERPQVAPPDLLQVPPHELAIGDHPAPVRLSCAGEGGSGEAGALAGRQPRGFQHSSVPYKGLPEH